MKQKLKCLSEQIATDLINHIEDNIGLYTSGSFEEMATEHGWSVELQVLVDLDPLKDLEGHSGQENEVKNALLVWQGLKDLTPSLACENRIWTRMTHLEGLTYSRQRWLKPTDSREETIKSVAKHFFADSRTKYRDDNAISRLWWIAYIASLAFPYDQKTALELILSKADYRLALIERPGIATRLRLTAGILREMMKDGWITQKGKNFGAFMKTVNKFGGGLLFEVWKDDEIDEFVKRCAAVAELVERQPA